ncbi:MAG: hypothetical protein ACJ77Z_04345 [Thermoleophilaceae bacterium]
MFVVILFLLGLSFGYAAGWPWGLLAFVVPLLLTLAASDRSGGAVVVGFVVTGIGVLAGLALAARRDEQHA